MPDPSFIHATQTLCPACPEIVAGRLVERAGDVYLESRCPTHGPASKFYYRDAALYRALLRSRNDVACCSEYRCARGEPCTHRTSNTMIFIVNVTNNCNMTCEACFSGSLNHQPDAYAPAETLLAALPDASKFDFTPHAVFLGGEPTLHPELPQMVEEVVRRGYIPRLASNGLRLRNARYARRLADAGLGWVFLHFDTADDTLNQRLRGRPMLDACLSAIARCREVGMKVQFGVTLSGENIDTTLELLRTAHRNGVFWVSLYTLAEIERTGAAGATFLADAIAAIEDQSGGQVRRSDFVAATQLWSRLYGLTGRPNYRQKPSMVSLPVVVDGAKMVPVNRFISPKDALGNPSALRRFVRSIPSLLGYEKRQPSGDTLVINIQQFQGRSAFDLGEAVHSLMSFVHDGSFIPFDVYNHVQRYAERDGLVPPQQLVRQAS